MIVCKIDNMMGEQEDKIINLIWTDKVKREQYKYMYLQNVRNYKNCYFIKWLKLYCFFWNMKTHLVPYLHLWEKEKDIP